MLLEGFHPPSSPQNPFHQSQILLNPEYTSNSSLHVKYKENFKKISI